MDRPSHQHQGLRFGPLSNRTLHVCVDMQRMFAAGGPWETPWLEQVRPVVLRLCSAHPDRAILTRFIPPYRAEQAPGTWRRFYERWPQVTRQQLDPACLDLLPELAALAPPAVIVDKATYSPFSGSALDDILAARVTEAVIFSGTETDVCVLAAALDAVDRGLRVIIVTDAICSSKDDTHDALMRLYQRRFGCQIETATCDEVLASWPG
ncbi:MAG: cysteine hydrolase family protein [Panacagrimonas sp.]